MTTVEGSTESENASPEAAEQPMSETAVEEPVSETVAQEPASETAGEEPAQEEAVEEPEPGTVEHPTHKWFAIHTYSGYEMKVKQTVEHRATLEGWRDMVTTVFIPTEMLIEIKSGKKRTVQRNLMPGYVLIQMEPSEDVFNLVKSIKGVSSFVGDGHSPAPLTQEEVTNLLDITGDKHEKPKPKGLYRKGDQVKVVEGPFVNFVGTVESVDEEKGKLSVMVSIFGRLTPVELDVLQVDSV